MEKSRLREWLLVDQMGLRKTVSTLAVQLFET